MLPDLCNPYVPYVFWWYQVYHDHTHFTCFKLYVKGILFKYEIYLAVHRAHIKSLLSSIRLSMWIFDLIWWNSHSL